MIGSARKLFVWSIALALACAALLSRLRSPDLVSVVGVVVAGRLQIITLRYQTFSVLFTDRVALIPERWRVHFDRTTTSTDLYRDTDWKRRRAESHSLGAFHYRTGKRGIYEESNGIELAAPSYVLMLPLMLLIAHWYWRVCVRSSRIERGECVACGYDLRGSTSDCCSECGVSIHTSTTRGAQRAGGTILLAKS
jgi:hypothetical protein